jgi:riboflavin synthase
VFTGLVEGTGRLLASVPRADARRLAFSHPGWDSGLEPGASVSVDGCCLTVVASDADRFETDVTGATLARTRFAELEPGEIVNLERPLAAGARLGGHVVQGHVDAVRRVAQMVRRGETCYLAVSVPERELEWVVPRGSIAINGVSLTVGEVDRDLVRLAVIPHTLATTNLSRLREGRPVHVEYDVLAKYVTAAVRRILTREPSP